MVVSNHPLQERLKDAEFGIVWEEVPCLQCGHERSKPVMEAADNELPDHKLRFVVCECRNCGLWYTNPRPSVESIGKFYAEDYSPHRKPRIAECRINRFTSVVSRWKGRPCIERHRMPWHGQGRLLDFGCGGGQFLLRMKEQGWKVAGLDTSEKVTRRLSDEFGLQTYSGTLPHPEIEPESFDVITMWAVLEHVHQPLETLREAYRLLAPGGRLYIQVPNRTSWNQRLFGEHSFTLQLPTHLTHFTRETLSAMLKASGFDVSSIRQISHPDWIRKSIRIARRSGAGSIGMRLLACKPVTLVFAWLAYLAGGSDNNFALAERPR